MSLWNENPTSILQIYFPDHFPEWPWFPNNTQQTGSPNKRPGVDLTKFSKTVLKNQFPKIIFRIKICFKTPCIICESNQTIMHNGNVPSLLSMFWNVYQDTKKRLTFILKSHPIFETNSQKTLFSSTFAKRVLKVGWLFSILKNTAIFKNSCKMGSKPSWKTREHGLKLTEGMVPENYMQMNGKLEAMPDGELFLLDLLHISHCINKMFSMEFSRFQNLISDALNAIVQIL